MAQKNEFLNKSLFFSSISGAFFGSSCCTLQLLLNALSFGCAGFAIFDKYNRMFNMFSLVSLSALFYFNKKQNKTILNSRSLQIAVLFSLIFGISPYFVNSLNQPSVSSDLNVEIKFKITEMKCMGCANAVHNILNELGSNQISFKDQTGILYNNGTKPHTIQDVKNLLSPLGYEVEEVK